MLSSVSWSGCVLLAGTFPVQESSVPDRYKTVWCLRSTRLWCFEIMCSGYCGVCWGGAAEKPRRAVTLKSFFGSQQRVTWCCCLHLLWEGVGCCASWDFPPRQWILAYQVMYLPVQIKELLFRFWVLSGRVIEDNTVMIPRWNHNGICTGKWNGNKNSWDLDFTQTGTCIISFSASLIITGPFYKYFSIYLNFPICFWAYAFLGSQFLF